MSVVFITVPGDEKRMFANALHKKTGGNVKLVIIQKPKRLSLPKRIRRLYDRTGWRNLPREFWYALLLRLDGAKRVLEYFRKYTISGPTKYVPKYIEVDSVNSDEVYKIIQEISPKLLVIWGNTILASRILETANTSINLHMGYCPFYTGALANQHAVLLEDFDRIGATIHYAKEKVDSGDILARLFVDRTKSPKEMFCDLNDRAVLLYLEIAEKIYAGKEVQSKPQDVAKSKNLFLRQWVPSVRYATGSKIIKLEKEFNK
jgi:folate-dependent phosphoribosylglycinamide formyltransferase PurN